MNLSYLLTARAADGAPVRVGLIGAGTFGTMFLAQARTTPGLHVAAVADRDAERAHTALALAQWPPALAVARSLADACERGGTWVTTDPDALMAEAGLDLVVEATGNAVAGLRHAAAAIDAGLSVIMVTVESDALAGPLLARRAADRGVVYSLAYGDQPALICQLVDWARTCGLEVAAAGKGTKYLPAYHSITPDKVWEHCGLTADRARAGGLSPRTFTSFLDGSRSAVEMAAVANATGLQPAAEGLTFPACGSHDLARLLKPRGEGGLLDGMGRVEVVSSLERDGRQVVGDLRHGVYVTFRAPGHYASSCFAEYGLATDDGGGYGALWRPTHLAGLELGVSVASVALRREPTGCPRAFVADAVAVAKRDLAAGDELDGEGGFTVRGALLPAGLSLERGALPVGLAAGIRLVRPVAAGRMLTWEDVEIDPADPVVVLRRRMEDTIITP